MGGIACSEVSVFGYLCLCLNVLFFSSLLVADPLTFQALTREDYWVESLTALWFLLAGLLLFVTALVERSFFRRCVYILGAMAMVFAAGEESSVNYRTADIGNLYEMREYLFGIGCLFYSLDLVLARGRPAIRSSAPVLTSISSRTS